MRNKRDVIIKNSSRESILKEIRHEMPYLREHFGVERLALFGSFARDEQSDISDIDILVYLSKPLGLAFIQLGDYLEDKLGRKVDLITATSLKNGAADPRRSHIARNIQESMIYV